MLFITWLSLAFLVDGLPKIRSYTDNGDGTVTDEVTGLMWEKNMVLAKWTGALAGAESARTGGYSDWRLPTLKELFSLILYSGSCHGDDSIELFIDSVFKQPLGDTSVEGGREIDAQTWSSSDFNGTTMGNAIEGSFGVNFVDGRVKAYPRNLYKYTRYVRGNEDYAVNWFKNNKDETISDKATGLMWSRKDSGVGMQWIDALEYAENAVLAGHRDWRLPTIKELNSIVDYTRYQGQAFINENYFKITRTTDPEGEDWYPYFWSSTTLLEGAGDLALYQTFGRALGLQNDTVMDAHGSGAVRGDPKSGDEEDYPSSTTGYQGDYQYVYNYVRIVRDINPVDKPDLTYPIVESDVSTCYNDFTTMNCPASGTDYFGQDASYAPVKYVASGPAAATTTNDGSETWSKTLIIIFGIVGFSVLAILGFCYCKGTKTNDQAVELEGREEEKDKLTVKDNMSEYDTSAVTDATTGETIMDSKQKPYNIALK